MTEEVIAGASRWPSLDPRVDRPPARAGRGRPGPQAADRPEPRASRLQRRGLRAGQALGTDRLAEGCSIADKAERNAATDEAAEDGQGRAAPPEDDPSAEGERSRPPLRSLLKKVVRRRIVDRGLAHRRPGPADLRPVSAEWAVIPTAHGSGLFQRGETQVLNVATLGMPRMDQMLDNHRQRRPQALHAPLQHAALRQRRDRPAWAPKRREIGHGLLAERALLPVVPPPEEFPYACASSPRC